MGYGEGRNGSANGAGASDKRASLSSLPEAPARSGKAQPSDYGLDPAKTHNSRELDAIIRRLIKTKNPDLRAFFDALTPHELSYIATTPEFGKLLLSLAARAVDGSERMTRGQYRALDYFRNKVQKAEDEKETAKPEAKPAEHDAGPEDDGEIIVEPLNGGNA